MPIDITVPQDYLDLLNQAVAREMQVSVQYILQHTKMDKLLRKAIAENILLDKTTYGALGEFLKTFAIEEMKHMANIIERLYILGGDAITKPSEITVGNSLQEFMKLGEQAEADALVLYRKIHDKAKEIGDRVTKNLFQKIYDEEEEHLLRFQEYAHILPEPTEAGVACKDSKWRDIFDPAYISLLNEALASEISAIVQYTNQHEKASSQNLRQKTTALEIIQDTNKAGVISAMLKPVFMQEMDHMEKIAERISELDFDVVADVKPLPQIGAAADDWIAFDRDAEDYAIVLYRKIVKLATEKGDITTKQLFEKILQDEEAHYWQFDDYCS